MFRKTILAITAGAVLGATALTPTLASAKGGFGGFGHHGFGWRGFGIGFVGAAVASAALATSCYQYQWVTTRRGYLVRVPVNVCE